MSQAGRFLSGGGGGGPLFTLTGNAGGAVPADGAGNINVPGGNNITSTGTPGLNTVQFDLTGTTNHSIQVGNATGSLTSLTAATNGQLPIGSTGVDPVIASLTAGDGVTIVNGPGSITISAPGGALNWNVVAVGTNMAVNNGYITNNAAIPVTLVLPAVAAVGDIIRVTGKAVGGWTITQGAGQTIFFGTASTTTGVAGFLSSTNTRDTVELLCVTANNDFNVLSSIGNVTVT